MKILFLLALLAFQPSSDPDGILDRGIQHFDRGEYRQAVELLAPLGKSKDATAKIEFWLGRSYLKVGEWDKAVNTLKKAVDMDPSNAHYHLWLGRAYGSRAENRIFGFNDARRLLKEYKKARDLAPEDIDIRFDLLEYYAQAPGIVGGSRDKAEEEAEAIAKLNPKLGYTARATIHERKKEWDRAEKEYRQATLDYPKDVVVHKDFALYLFNRGEYEKALKSAIQVLELDCTSKQGLYVAAACRIELGTDLDTAEGDLETIARGPLGEGDPSLEDVYYRLGLLHKKQGNTEKAREALKKALEIHPGYEKAEKELKEIG